MTDRLLFGDDGWAELNRVLEGHPLSQIHILVDDGSAKHCLPIVLDRQPNLKTAQLTVLPSGETSKTMENAGLICASMLKQGISKQGLLICIGGGMITDLGGFSASIYKRGLPHVNVATTLMAQVDAAIGGKTAVNLGGAKNQVGCFHWPIFTLMDDVFLKTLPEQQYRNGMAEVIKHALIADATLFDALVKLNGKPLSPAMLRKSANIKLNIVKADPLETGLRKSLNFGHTIGHAIEAHFMHSAQPMLHGEAVAHGMAVELAISSAMGLLTDVERTRCEALLHKHFTLRTFRIDQLDSLMSLMGHDKKNQGGQVNFTLLQSIGKAVIDRYPAPDLIRQTMLDVLCSR